MVIIKGFMDEPARLDFVNKGNKVTTVLCRDGITEMNFANDMVYEDDGNLFKILKDAYELGDTERLTREWQRAKPVISPESKG